MRAKAILFLAAILITGGLRAEEPVNIPSSKKNFHLFLLMGQSNMSGGVGLAAGDTKPVPSVLKMRWAKEGEEPKWALSAHPLHPRRPNKKARFGPGLSFAEAYVADKPGVTVGLIPMAWGGKSIEQLGKGSGIYSDAIRHAKAAMQVGTLKGVLWHQGESDTVEQTRTDAYEKRLHLLIEDVRKDLGNPQLPFIVGNLAEFYGTGKDHKAPDRVARIDKIKEILRRLPEKVPHTGFVESTGCSPAARAKVHFDRKSCVLLGKRYAEVYSDLVDKTLRPNVMFIIVDDLRAELGSYGSGQMKTPNFDRLAKQSMQFNRAYVQQAICSASRASFLTGCRPNSTGVDHPYTPWFDGVFRKKYKPIAQYFADLGYYSRTLGKVHHGPRDSKLTERHFAEKAPDYLLPENKHGARGWGTVYDRLLPWEHADLPDNAFRDGQIADETIATIRRAHASEKPFFIVPGFQKPHLPFVCPKKYYDLYSDQDARRSPNPERGPGQPLFTIPKEINGIEIFDDFPKTGLADKDIVHGIRSYYACVSFIDAQLGKILDELDRLQLMDSTLVVVLSDHGFHLGDHGNWGKMTCFEHATRSPLYVKAPGMKTSGTPCDALVEYVDLFPTVLDLCGFDVPPYMEGASFGPLLKNPSQAWKKAAFSQFPRKTEIDGKRKNIEGYSIRTKDYRFTQWRERGTDKVIFEEFYDNRKDHTEDKNHAANPVFKTRVDEHRRLLRAGWKKALPPGVENSSELTKGDDAWYYKPKEPRRVPQPPRNQ